MPRQPKKWWRTTRAASPYSIQVCAFLAIRHHHMTVSGVFPISRIPESGELVRVHRALGDMPQGCWPSGCSHFGTVVTPPTNGKKESPIPDVWGTQGINGQRDATTTDCRPKKSTRAMLDYDGVGSVSDQGALTAKRDKPHKLTVTI